MKQAPSYHHADPASRKLFRLGERACCSAHRYARLVITAMCERSRLLIRKSARFLIRMQDTRLAKRKASDASGYGFTAPDRDKGEVAGPARRNRGTWLVLATGAILAAFAIGWFLGANAVGLRDHRREEPTGKIAVDAVVEQIIHVESNGDPNAKNKRSKRNRARTIYRRNLAAYDPSVSARSRQGAQRKRNPGVTTRPDTRP